MRRVRQPHPSVAGLEEMPLPSPTGTAPGHNLTPMSATGVKARRQSATALAGWVAIGTAGATLAVLVLPFVRFAYRAPALHVVLETTNALIALLVGYLVYGRFQQSRRLQDFLLVLGLCTVAVANLVLTALPSAVTNGSEGEFSRWSALAIRFLGTLLLASAAVTTAQIRLGRGGALVVVLLLAGLVLAVGGAELVWGGHLPPTVDPAADLGDATRPQLVAHPLVLATQAVGAVLYGVAAVAFSRRSDRRGDEFFRWGCRSRPLGGPGGRLRPPLRPPGRRVLPLGRRRLRPGRGVPGALLALPV